jgi:hypothetical protein
MEEGAFFSVDELKAVFPRLKRNEALLSVPERRVLWRIEKTLYTYLSVEEIESALGGTVE